MFGDQVGDQDRIVTAFDGRQIQSAADHEWSKDVLLREIEAERRHQQYSIIGCDLEVVDKPIERVYETLMINARAFWCTRRA